MTGGTVSVPSTVKTASGLTNVHVNRVMRYLRDEKLCIFRSSLVEILNLEGLAARGQFDPDYLYLDDRIVQA